MKTAKMLKSVFPIASTMSVSDVQNAYFGGSNLTAEYRNDYSASDTARFIGEWIEDNVNKRKLPEGLDICDIIENPDLLLQACASELCSALTWILGDSEEAEKLMRSDNRLFDAWGNFYLFARPFSNACTEYWLIRSDSESSAYEELTERFESAFSVDDEDVTDETEMNGNGTHVNTDNLVLLGSIIEGDE